MTLRQALILQRIIEKLATRDPSWQQRDTTTHQDHVIAHVLGTNLLGYFVFDEALFALLDIGFIWTIFLDGEMNLLPHPVAIGELEVDAQHANELRADIELLLSDNPDDKKLTRMTSAASQFEGLRHEIREVNFFGKDDGCLFQLDCGEVTLAVETSLTTRGISVYECE